MYRTCSLRCVKHHKTRIGCSGERDRAAFIATKEFREEDLLSDYTLLEELARKAEELAKEEAAAQKKKWNNQDGALKYKVRLLKITWKNTITKDSLSLKSSSSFSTSLS